MKYVLYFGFWIAVFYAVIKFGISSLEDVEKQGEEGRPDDGAAHTDPICGMKVEDAKWTSQFEGKTYYFCAESCKDAFEKEPGKYAVKG